LNFNLRFDEFNLDDFVPEDNLSKVRPNPISEDKIYGFSKAYKEVKKGLDDGTLPKFLGEFYSLLYNHLHENASISLVYAKGVFTVHAKTDGLKELYDEFVKRS